MSIKTSIKLLAMDVDGTLTDGRIHISDSGELFKSFDAKDGYAVKVMLPKHGIVPAVITGRRSGVVERRCAELGIEHLYQNITDKAACLRKLAEELNVPLDHVACIGDDRNDLPMLELCGFSACPADAAEAVKRVCDYVCQAPGGRGAVRELVERLIEAAQDRL